MESGAEVISTNLLWAAGYHVPENYVFHLDPSKLVLDEDVELDAVEGDSVVHYEVGADDPEHELTREFFERHVLEGYPRRTDGAIRALASKFLEGIPKGPFTFEGMRDDDPNDVIPHEHRRELRGLYVVAAWLNHVDTKEGNNLDMLIVHPSSPKGEDATKIGYLKHHFLDFGSTLGSRHDHRNAGAVMLRFLTLGAYKLPWQRMEPYPKPPPATGYYSVDNFDPADWRPNIVNPAFVNRDARDGYWGAKIVMSFSDKQIEAALRAGQYSDPATVAYLRKALRERRDATRPGRYWFRQVSPLDRPRVEAGAVVFDDLWVRHFGGTALYECRLSWEAADLEDRGRSPLASISLPTPRAPLTAGDRPERAHARLEVWKALEGGARAPRPATIWLSWDERAR